jgi:hypothetical protein
MSVIKSENMKMIIILFLLLNLNSTCKNPPLGETQNLVLLKSKSFRIKYRFM